MLKTDRIISLVFISFAVGLVLTTLAISGCGGTAASMAAPESPAVSGCRQDVESAPGKILPETSELTCSQIKQLIAFAPAEAGKYLLEGGSGGPQWQCQKFGPGSKHLLECSYQKRHFAILNLNAAR